MSGNNNQFDCELISAYLDDALSDSERQQAVQLLASDDQAARYLEQLRATRECLRSVASHPLRSSVADRVIARARAEAVAQGLSPDHHVLRAANATDRNIHLVIPSSLDNSQRSASPADGTADNRLPRNNRILWSALLTIAAAIACMVVLPNYFFDGSAQPGGTLQPDGMISQNAPDSLVAPGSTGLADGSKSSDPGDDAEISPFDRVVSPSVAVAEEPSAAVGTDALIPEAPGMSRGPAVPSGVTRVMEGNGSADALRKDLEPLEQQFDYLFIVDSVMSHEAWKSSYFDTLLKQVGVPMANPITADSELTKLLDESLVSVGKVGGKDAADNGRAALLFIRAKGRNVDELLFEMSKDGEHFPSVTYNMAVDANQILLKQLLRKQGAASAGGELGARIVRSAQEPLVSTELVPNFVPHDPPKLRGSSKDSRQEDLGMKSLSALDGLTNAANPIAEVLVILRETPAK